MKVKRRAISGKVVTVDGRDTASGSFVVEARIRNDEGIYLCTLWDKLAHDFMAANLLNKKVQVDGYSNQEGGFTVKYFTTPDAPRPREVITEQDRAAVGLYHARHGGMLVYNKNLKKSIVRLPAACIKVNGEWTEKIEYCMEHMGPKAVTEFFREVTNEGEIASLKIDPKLIRDKIDVMIKYAMEDRGDYVEGY